MSKVVRVMHIVKSMTKSERQELAEAVTPELPLEEEDDNSTDEEDMPPHLDSIMVLLSCMSDEEREAAFEIISEEYCPRCGFELPEEGSKEPDHRCNKDKLTS